MDECDLFQQHFSLSASLCGQRMKCIQLFLKRDCFSFQKRDYIERKVQHQNYFLFTLRSNIVMLMYSMHSLFLMTLLTGVQSQIWTGTFNITPSCNTAYCCCFSGQLVMTQPVTSTLSITTGLDGLCFGLSTFSIIIPYPTGYTSSVALISQLLSLTLGSDSNTITITNNLIPQCNGNSIRNDANKHNINVMILIIVGFIGTLVNDLLQHLN